MSDKYVLGAEANGLRSMGIDERKGLGGRESSTRTFECAICSVGGQPWKISGFCFCAAVHVCAHVIFLEKYVFFLLQTGPFACKGGPFLF